MNSALMKETITWIYYLIAALAILMTLVRVLYSWFKDYDNANNFIVDMATIHLPYLYECNTSIALSLGVPIKPPPTINFARHKPQA